MKSSREILRISFVTTLFCFILLIILYFLSDMKCIFFTFIKDIVLAIFSGSFMTIVFSYIQMKIYEQELLTKFQNTLIKIIEICNIDFKNREDYKRDEECSKSYKEFKKLRDDIFIIAIDLREIYFYVNIRTRNNDILSIQRCTKYIIELLKKMDDFFFNFKNLDNIKEWKDWEKDKLLNFNNILWYEIIPPDSEEEIQEISEKTNFIGYVADSHTLYYSKVFYDIMEIYPGLIYIYNFDI